jgi:iron complex outermembrane recepter protein
MTTLPLQILLLAASSQATETVQQPTVVPPKVLEAPSAVYPTGHHEDVEVDLRVLVDTTGQVAEVEVTQSAGADFDNAARTAVLRWHFEPAQMSGVPFAARIKIPFIFRAPPEPDGGAAPPAADAGTPVVGAPVVSPPEAIADGGQPSALPTVSAVAPVEIGVPTATTPGAPEEVNVRGQQRKVDRGGSDFQIQVGQLATIAGHSVEDLLQLAPGIFLANEGGQGHADQVFLRGFDAQTGAGIEFSVNGVPINEVDNTDGHGYADTHFIIPEVVKELRVVEGPFDPHQGDFAEAGSVDYELGVPERRLQISATYGSFGTERALALWAPQGERDGTFAAVQAETSNGYGQNRAGTDASAMAQYEGELGQRGLWRLLLTAYGTQYQSAGIVRSDDVANGVVGFYGTEDSSQGGSAQRYTASLSLENPVANEGLLTQQLFFTYRTLTLDEDFTGFLLDDISPGQTPHGQRGDAILQNYEAATLGGRGSYKVTRNLFGEDQSVELGYFARYDHTTPQIDRLRFGTQIPYLVDEDMVTDVFNIAGYLDLDIHLGDKLTLRGGVRQEYFNYDIENLCAASSPFISGGGIGVGLLPNVPCPNFDSAGPRLANQQTIAAGLITEPKATLIYQVVPSLAASASFGIGATSQDATQISQDEQTPFTQIIAAELGVKYHRRFERADLSGRLVGYFTHTSADVYFNPDQGRLTPTGATERGGGVFEARLAGPWYDELVSGTYAYAVYDADHTLVPYIPNLIARSDTVLFHRLPLRIGDHALLGKVGLGLNYIGQRALPLGQFASPTFVMNASVKVRWSFVEIGVEGRNLLNSQYPLSEFFYASYFPHSSGITYPTLAPVEAFTAAPPFTILATLSLIFDKENDR